MKTLSFKKSKTSFRLRKFEDKPNGEGISCLDRITLGGVDQWILIRGRNRHNPILLCLHGGPGTAQIAFAPRYQSELEKHFVVVNWDQRGSGKSFSGNITKDSMTISQLVSDTCELVETLLKRFNREKLFLLGHSWGSVLGMLSVQNCPGCFYAYFGLGQVVDIYETGKILYRFLMESATKNNNQKAIKELEAIGFPPAENTSRLILSQIKWAEKLGGVFSRRGLKKEIIKTVIKSDKYSLHEKLNYYKASFFSFDSIIKQLLDVNLMEQVPEVKIPVYFFAGKKDYNTPFELAEKYYKNIKAPEKQFFGFEDAGHAPHFEEPERFSEILIKEVIPQVYRRM